MGCPAATDITTTQPLPLKAKGKLWKSGLKDLRVRTTLHLLLDLTGKLHP